MSCDLSHRPAAALRQGINSFKSKAPAVAFPILREIVTAAKVSIIDCLLRSFWQVERNPAEAGFLERAR